MKQLLLLSLALALVLTSCSAPALSQPTPASSSEALPAAEAQKAPLRNVFNSDGKHMYTIEENTPGVKTLWRLDMDAAVMTAIPMQDLETNNDMIVAFSNQNEVYLFGYAKEYTTPSMWKLEADGSKTLFYHSPTKLGSINTGFVRALVDDKNLYAIEYNEISEQLKGEVVSIDLATAERTVLLEVNSDSQTPDEMFAVGSTLMLKQTSAARPQQPANSAVPGETQEPNFYVQLADLAFYAIENGTKREIAVAKNAATTNDCMALSDTEFVVVRFTDDDRSVLTLVSLDGTQRDIYTADEMQLIMLRCTQNGKVLVSEMDRRTFVQNDFLVDAQSGEKTPWTEPTVEGWRWMDASYVLLQPDSMPVFWAANADGTYTEVTNLATAEDVYQYSAKKKGMLLFRVSYAVQQKDDFLAGIGNSVPVTRVYPTP